MKKIVLIILGVLCSLLFLISYQAFGWGGVHGALAWVIIYTLIFSCLLTLAFLAIRLVMSLFRPVLRQGVWSWAMMWFQRFLIVVCFFLVLLPLIFAGLIYGFNEWWPGTLTRYELTNGKKTIVFQSMSHLASSEFYDEVKEDIQARGDEGYVLFYEGVRPGTLQNEQAFSDALGFTIDQDFYTAFQKLTGLTYQGDVSFTGLAQQDFNVDLSVDDIMRLYEQYDFDLPGPALGRDMSEILSDIRGSFDDLTSRQRATIQYGYRAAFNFLLRLADKGELSLPTQQIPLFTVILDDRNAHIAQAIHESEYDNIYLTYGALHYEGVLENLKQLQQQAGLSDGEQEWMVVEMQELTPIQ